jgi:hypothetical protein
MMLAIKVRLFRLPGLKRISQGVILGGQILPAKAKPRERLTSHRELVAALIRAILAFFGSPSPHRCCRARGVHRFIVMVRIFSRP